MKKFLLTNVACLFTVFMCESMTPTERAILDAAAQRAINAGLDKISPAPVAVKVQK